MESVVIHAEDDIRVEERPIPQLQTDEDILVKVISSGFCGPGIPHTFNHGAHCYPITLGHEFNGCAKSYSASVTDLQPGDTVACVSLLPRFHYPQYERGYFSLCKQYQFADSRNEGGSAECVVVKRINLFRLPPDTPIGDGAFVEPITVGLHVFHLAQRREGKNVAIAGAGIIDLLAMQRARGLGARSVTTININPQKLALTEELGTTYVFNGRETGMTEIHAGLEDIQFDQLVLETAGTPQTMTLSIEVVDPRTQLVLIGTLRHDLMLASDVFGQILRKELTILGSWMNYSSSWPGEEWETAIRLLTGKRLQLEPLIAYASDIESFVSAVKSLRGAPM